MPMYVFECTDGHQSESVFSIDNRPATVGCNCGKRARRIMAPSVVHGFEEHLDENLMDEGGTKAFHVKSRDHKRRRLRDLNLEERDPSAAARKKHKDVIYSYKGVGKC